MSDSNNLALKRIGTYDLSGYRLGKGNFAYVELATNRITKTKVAMKVIDAKKIRDDYMKKNILREAQLLKKVNHPNIVRLYETLKQRSVYCIVTEFVPGGELLSFLRTQNDSKLSESQARPIMRQLISALYHMHEQGIVHRDLKMENILLDEEKKNIKIVDFGLSNICEGDNLLKTQCGSPEYAAPELFRCGCRYGTEVDLWSLGVIMYGIVVGQLPFRSPHHGCRGRNELVDQSSRGLSSTHYKYLGHLTHQCRDLLRKLLEPRPELRLPLLEVMVHPWVTVQGTAPLVPYTEQPIDEKLHEKVLRKVSQLINISKSKIALHVQQKRYDAMAAVFNLLLDEELKLASKSYCDQSHLDRSKDNSVIRVTISTVEKDRKETENQAGTQEMESECVDNSEGPEPQPLVTQEEQQDSPTFTVQDPNENSDNTKSQGLWIKGSKIYTKETRCPKNFPHARTRPNTGSPDLTPEENILSLSGPGSPAMNRARCKSCIPRIAPKFDSKVQGKRMFISPRPESEVADTKRELARHPKIRLETENPSAMRRPDSCHSEDSKANANNFPTKEDDRTLKSDVNTEEVEGVLRVYEDTPRVVETPETTTSDRNNVGPTLQTSPNFIASMGTTVTNKRMPPSSLAAPSPSRAISPLKKVEFIDLTDNHKYAAMSPKARINELLGEGTKLVAKEIENEESINSFGAAFQSYRISKPHHQRLSIMQAQDIIQYESKFHAKYGRKSGAETTTNNTQPASQVEKSKLRYTHGGSRCVTPSSPVSVRKKAHDQHRFVPDTGYVKGVSLQKDKAGLTELHAQRDENNENQTALCLGNNVELNQSADWSLCEDNKKNLGKLYECNLRLLGGASNYPTQARGLDPRQEESLKRQKEKEDTENREKEKLDFLKELEDQGRQKMITEYLQLMYTRYEQRTPTKNAQTKPEPNSRTFKVSKQGRFYSIETRSTVAKKSGSGPLQIITRPTPILHSAARGAQGEKKIIFKAQPGEKGKNGVRFVNDWNNDLFTEYINSSERDTTRGNETDALQKKDPSFWLEQHLNGVLDESTVGRRNLHNCQKLTPRET